jgi:metal-dependent amidase/aminoacylase/carboxypeptidase family protein
VITDAKGHLLAQGRWSAPPFIGTAPADGPAAPCHSSTMRVNEDALPAGVAMYAALALQVVCPDFL